MNGPELKLALMCRLLKDRPEVRTTTVGEVRDPADVAAELSLWADELLAQAAPVFEVVILPPFELDPAGDEIPAEIRGSTLPDIDSLERYREGVAGDCKVAGCWGDCPRCRS